MYYQIVKVRMLESTMTRKGQITIPKAIRDSPKAIRDRL
jgi:hypothetical protein